MNGTLRAIVIVSFLSMSGTLLIAADSMGTGAAPATVKKKKAKTAKKKAAHPAKKAAPAAASATPPKAPPATPPATQSTAQTSQIWFKNLKERLSRNQAKQNQIVAVAAVRGDEASAAAPLYWKGKGESGDASEDLEARRFGEAVDAALSGNDADARTKFTYFVTTYPQSSLKSDAEEALRRLGDGK